MISPAVHNGKTVDVVIPVYNEERDLPRCIAVLRPFLKEHLGDGGWRILVADNGSTDNTLKVAQGLARQYPEVSYLHIPEKGRGRALKQAWLGSQADIVSFMDVDLSTGLGAFPQLLQALDQGNDLAIGSRYQPTSRVRRSWLRAVLSRSYNLLLRVLFWPPFADAQCGFKAARRTVAQELLARVRNPTWFFDSELLLRARKSGYRIKEVPVEWHEDPDSRVGLSRAILGMMLEALRLRWALWWGG